MSEPHLFPIEPQFQPGIYALDGLAVGTNPDKPHTAINPGSSRVIVSDIKYYALFCLQQAKAKRISVSSISFNA